MSDGEWKLATEAACLAAMLPQPLLLSLAEALGSSDPSDGASTRLKAVQAIPHPHYRNRVSQFVEQWVTDAPTVTPQAVSLALRTAARMEQTHRDQQAIELVWTGPPTNVVPLRRTEQAILQILDSAHRRLLVVSYAVYNIPRIGAALVRAADRGVALTVVLETPDRQAGTNAYDTLRALGHSVASRSRCYLWPSEQRAKDPNGKQGILHVKCVAADGAWLFLSSANLTEYAFNLNMELGVLIQGGGLPTHVETHFETLIASGVLVAIERERAAEEGEPER
jgi:phosphatidylserine/phosphatidylglycerophosphate/cardiolipin synthase-like enzyme